MFVFAGFKCQMRVCQLEKRGQCMLVGVMQPQILFHICKPGSVNKGRKMVFFLISAQRAKLLFSFVYA